MSSATVQQATTHLQALLRETSALLSRHRNALLTAGIPVALLLLLFPAAKRDYDAFKSLGKGGLPPTPLGWVISRLFGLLAHDTKSIDVYDTLPEKRQWLSPLPQREGLRPTIGQHVLPHRQVDQFPPETVKAAVRVLIKDLHRRYPDATRVAPSALEGRTGDGLFVRDEVPCPAAENALSKERGREIGHAHPQMDCSFHAVLAPQDCKEVIAKGWGERHPLSGRFGEKDSPINFLFLYAPRTEQELETVTRIMEAALGYMTNNVSSAVGRPVRACNFVAFRKREHIPASAKQKPATF
ncbi:hypothetical protein HDZ31DRAFT_61324 [Schizophyllum fasciatum]